MTWTAASDAHSGLDGYAYEFNSTAMSTCDEVLDSEETETSVSSSALADGDWYFHICAADNASNWASAVTAGPYTIDTEPIFEDGFESGDASVWRHGTLTTSAGMTARTKQLPGALSPYEYE